MTAFTDRDKLREAFPAGYLALAGMPTIGGWRCTLKQDDVVIFNDAGAAGACWMRFMDGHFDKGCQQSHDPLDRATVESFVAQGWLLPVIDPADPLAWAGALAELARLSCPEWNWSEYTIIQWTNAPLEPIDGDDTDTPTGLGVWWLVLENTGIHPSYARVVGAHYFCVDTDDPAAALVAAFIQLRGVPDAD